MCSSLYMTSQGNHQAVACYQLPVLDEKCSWLRFLTWGTHRNLKSWGTVSASCTARTACQCWVMIKVCLDLWVHLLGTSFFEGFCFLPCSTKEKDFVSGKQLLTFAWHLNKTQTLAKFHFQLLKCGKIPHFLWSVPKPSELLLRTRLWEQSIPCACVCVCGAPLMTICVEQHQPHRHLGGSPKLRNFQEIIPAALLPNQPGTDMETESRFPVPPPQAFRQHGAYTGRHHTGWRGW